jgi:4a-hydroxytetrahydrobiopterin dehydratase
MGQPLHDDELAAALVSLPAWTGNTNGLRRTASLPTFPDAVAVVDGVAVAAEEMNHHPDIDIRWRTVTFHLATHDAGDRVTSRDIELAGRIDAIIDDHSADDNANEASST